MLIGIIVMMMALWCGLMVGTWNERQRQRELFLAELRTGEVTIAGRVYEVRPRRPVPHEPEVRALRQILAEPAARGEQVMILGEAGVLEIRPVDPPGQRFLAAN